MSDLIIVSIVAAVPGTIAAVASLITTLKMHKVEKGVNGLHEELLATTRKEAFAAGAKQERDTLK